jgi:Asp-tRNA(Asn)/Glu-tRNA(Gln) amidotransferase C subunit
MSTEQINQLTETALSDHKVYTSKKELKDIMDFMEEKNLALINLIGDEEHNLDQMKYHS